MSCFAQTSRNRCGLQAFMANKMERTRIFTCILALLFHRKAFKLAFELLQGGARTGCQSIIVFATDGVDNDGDPVRCGPGSYTRSGYVPGKTCKYDWNDVWDEVAARNRYMNPRVSYKIVVFKYFKTYNQANPFGSKNLRESLSSDITMYLFGSQRTVHQYSPPQTLFWLVTRRNVWRSVERWFWYESKKLGRSTEFIYRELKKLR